MLEIAEVCGLEGDMVTMNEIFAFDYRVEDSGRVSGRWRTPGSRPSFMERLDQHGLADAWMNALRDA